MKKNSHKLLRRLLTMHNGVEITIKSMTLDALLLQKTFYFKVDISKNKPRNK